MRNTSLLAATILVTAAAGAGAGGCQPRPSADAAASPAVAGEPAVREPVRRVEVMSASSTELKGSIVGRKCRVQLRRDALGMASTSTAAMSGRWADQASVDGTIVEMTDQWLVVQATGKRVVVPHASILVIELQD